MLIPVVVVSGAAVAIAARTDRDGTVEVSADRARLVVRPDANGLPPPRPQGIPHLGR